MGAAKHDVMIPDTHPAWWILHHDGDDPDRWYRLHGPFTSKSYAQDLEEKFADGGFSFIFHGVPA